MTIVDYGTLQSAVQDFANRIDSSVVARTGDMIRLAEDRIWRTNPNGVIRSQSMITRVPLVIPAGQNWVALPSDWLAFSRLTLPSVPALDGSQSNELEYVSPDRLEDLPPPGNANLYSIEGGRLLYGLPQQAGGLDQTINAKYFAHPGNLSASLTSTWLLQQAPSIYLYAALVECAIYVKRLDKAQEYQGRLDGSIAGFMSTEKAALISGSRIRYRRA